MRLWRRKQEEPLSENEKRQWQAMSIIGNLDVQFVNVDGQRLPDGRTEVRIEVVGFEEAEPWLRRNYQEHPGVGT